MSILRFLYSFMIISIFATLTSVSPILANSNQEAASLAIANAEEAIISAYKAVLEAEQAGSNVTGLWANLTTAGESLATARMLYRNGENGDFNNAIYVANLCKEAVKKAEEVKEAAYELKDLAWNDSFQRTWFTMIGSISGIFLVVLGSLWVWRFLRGRYQ